MRGAVVLALHGKECPVPARHAGEVISDMNAYTLTIRLEELDTDDGVEYRASVEGTDNDLRVEQENPKHAAGNAVMLEPDDRIRDAMEESVAVR